jgi:hypothetical protein
LRNVDALGRPGDVAFGQNRVERYQQVEVKSLYVQRPPLVSTSNCGWKQAFRKTNQRNVALAE